MGLIDYSLLLAGESLEGNTTFGESERESESQSFITVEENQFEQS